MKNLKAWAIIVCIAIGFISCNSDDTIIASDKKVDAYIQFENVFAGSAFALNKNYTSINNGVVNITTLKYMITDITLHGSDGTKDYMASTQESFHIVDQACEVTNYKYLTNVPDGKYNKISFRYGVSEDVFELGTDAQGDMLVRAKEAGLNWGWTTGYRFLTYEGSHNNGTGSFKVHNGSHGSTGHGEHSGVKVANTITEQSDAPTVRVENSKLITLAFPNSGKILVSNNTSPKVHLKLDVAKILNSIHVLDVSKGDIVIDQDKSPKVAENVGTMFSVHHIHGTDKEFDLEETEACKDISNPNEEGGNHSHGDTTEKDDHSHV